MSTCNSDQVLEDFPELRELWQKGKITEEELNNAIDIICSHQCRRCGVCCTHLVVRVSQADINRLKKIGYKEEEFIRDDCLKLNDGGCVFLRKNSSEYRCAIHPYRPLACRRFPFSIEYSENGLKVNRSDKCKWVH
ncbi:MAG: YkgJ family cysteine cluster protein [Methanosarcinales archaeon]